MSLITSRSLMRALGCVERVAQRAESSAFLHAGGGAGVAAGSGQGAGCWLFAPGSWGLPVARIVYACGDGARALPGLQGT